jgi:hypothetical protein
VIKNRRKYLFKNIRQRRIKFFVYNNRLVFSHPRRHYENIFSNSKKALVIFLKKNCRTATSFFSSFHIRKKTKPIEMVLRHLRKSVKHHFGGDIDGVKRSPVESRVSCRFSIDLFGSYFCPIGRELGS